MSSERGVGRTPGRIAAEVCAFGALVLVVTLLARGRDPAPATDGAAADTPSRPAAPPSVEPPEDAEPPPSPPIGGAEARSALPTAAAEWRTLSDDRLAALGRGIAERTPGFRFDRVEVFRAAERSNALAVLVHEPTALEFSLIPPGNYLMGSPSTEPGRSGDETQRRITIARPFLICRTECTQDAWDRVGGEDARWRSEAARPITGFTLDQLETWLAKAGLRLPSEAEWEYACRAGTSTRFWSGDEDSDAARVGWLGESRTEGPHPVGEKDANPFGLHDVHGNAWEICADSRREISPEGAPTDGSAWLAPGSTLRLLRGGTLIEDARHARSASRSGGEVSPSMNGGFRPACSIGPD